MLPTLLCPIQKLKFLALLLAKHIHLQIPQQLLENIPSSFHFPSYGYLLEVHVWLGFLLNSPFPKIPLLLPKGMLDPPEVAIAHTLHKNQ